MKKYIFIALAVLSALLVLGGGIYYACKPTDAYLDGATNKEMRDTLCNLIENQYADLKPNMSIYVYDLTENAHIFGYNFDEPLRPASCMKLLTVYTAYTQLSRRYRTFDDSLFVSGTIQNSVLKGDIIFKASYDPTLMNCEKMARKIKECGIKKIEGDLKFRLIIKNSMDKGADIPAKDIPVLYRGYEYVMKDFKTQLNKIGIKQEGKSQLLDWETVKYVGEQAKCIGDWHVDLNDVMAELMLKSDNRYAEALLYCISNIKGLAMDGNGHGPAVIEKTMKNNFKLLNISRYTFDDGSGLSYKNKLSARLLVNVLKASYKNSSFYAFLMNKALPMVSSNSSRKGTLKKRMIGTSAENNVHAKTGTLWKIPTSSLAGYCTAKNGHTLCFAIICNGTSEDNALVERFRAFQNDFCVVMCD